MKAFFNNRKQLVGHILDDEIYLTERDMKKGQIFCKKTQFEGKYIPNGVAVDSEILKRLVQMNIKKIMMRIKNLESIDFYKEIYLDKFLTLSAQINYDTGTRNGYGTQRVCSLDQFIKINKYQTKLIEE